MIGFVRQQAMAPFKLWEMIYIQVCESFQTTESVQTIVLQLLIDKYAVT